MTDPLFTWLVWPERMPLNGKPLELGTVQAPTLAAAKCEAAERWPGVAVVIQSAASARVRPRTALPTEVKQPINSPASHRKAKDYRRSKSRQQLDAFCAAKRRAHDATRGDRT